eukprot:352945-Chlamydomonas_euryale.AAC.1
MCGETCVEKHAAQGRQQPSLGHVMLHACSQHAFTQASMSTASRHAQCYHPPPRGQVPSNAPLAAPGARYPPTPRLQPRVPGTLQCPACSPGCQEPRTVNAQQQACAPACRGSSRPR